MKKMLPSERSVMNPRRRQCMVAFAVASAVSICGVADAFTTPSSQCQYVSPQLERISPNVPRSRSVFLAVKRPDFDYDEEAKANESINPIDEITRPLLTAATSAFLATSLLFSTPLLPTPGALAAPTVQSSQTATSIDIDLKSVPALTRKAIVNREKLTNYLIDSFKSFKPILDLLSESNSVTVKPPSDIKGAINQALTKGDAQFVVNGEAVDVRVESVPGVIIVRVINPNIPRLPFLKDGTAALKFVDGIVDEAPREFEKAAEEVEGIKKFLMWGAPQKAPIQYKGSSLDYFLSSKFLINGEAVSLGALGELTNSEVVFLGVTTGVAAAYSASYAYYVKLQEDADREAAEKKANVAAKKKAKADAAKAKKAKADADAAAKKAEEEEKEAGVKAAKEEKEADEKVVKEAEETRAAFTAVAETTNDETGDEGVEEDETTKGRKRDVFKRLFGRGKQ